MIGSVANGTMIDNQVEGWPGFRIDQLTVKADLTLPDMPNLIIIHLGTNDALQGFEISTAADRLGSLIDHCLEAVPNTAVLVSTIIPNADKSANADIDIINAAIPGMVAERADAGKLVFLVDQHSVIALADLNADGTHPLDGIFEKPAECYAC